MDADFLLEGASAKELEQSSKRLRSPPLCGGEPGEVNSRRRDGVRNLLYTSPLGVLGNYPPFLLPLLNEKTLAQL